MWHLLDPGLGLSSISALALAAVESSGRASAPWPCGSGSFELDLSTDLSGQALTPVALGLVGRLA